MPKLTRQPRLSIQVAELRRRLTEAEEVVQAIRSGEVDALVVSGPHGEQVYTLKDATHPYQVVLQEMNEGALTLSREGTILYANRRMTEILGTPLERVLGEPLARFVIPSDRRVVKLLLQKSLGSQANGEVTFAAGAQATLPATISMTRVILDRVPRISAIVSDITERKRAEEQAHRYTAELEQRVAERTAELQQALEQERATRITLEATNKELEAFAYTVSHDFRGPLNQINELARMVVSDHASELPKSATGIVNLIHDHAAALNCLAEDLLTLTRLSQQALEKTTVSMTDLVRQVLDELEEERAGRQVEIKVGDLPAVEADPRLLKQVWRNLIANALKFTRKRKQAWVEIGAFREEARTVYFVKDNGAGFNMAQASRMFRAFQRLHHPEDFEGSGLGLTIVDRVIRRHGGRVWAEGQVNRGATFYFTLG